MSRAAGTVAIPYIYLKARSHRLIPTKKAHFPSSFQTLMKICNRLFKSIGVVRSLFNSEGKLITKIEEVLPGSTIYVSSLDPDRIAEGQNIGIMSQTSEVHPGRSMRDYNSDYFNQYYKPIIRNISDIPDDTAKSIHDESFHDQQSTRSKFDDDDIYSVTSRSSVPVPKKLSESEVEEEEEVKSEVTMLSEESFVSQHSAVSQHTYSNTFDNISSRSDKSKKRDPNEACSDLVKLLSELLGTEQLNEKTEDGYESLVDWMQRLLGPSVALEREQMERWFVFSHALKDQQAIPQIDQSATVEFDALRQYVRDVIARHRFFTTKINDYSTRIAIAGPRESGKTHILSMFIDEILLDYAATGLWKQTFFMFLNFRIIRTFINDPAQLYHNFVDLTLQAVAWQKPTLSKYMPLIRKTFYQLTETKMPPRFQINTQFYQENPLFASALQKILNQFSELWNDPDSFSQWMTAIYLLPSSIASAIGYTKVFFFIDNFEFADCELSSHPPFSQANPSTFNIEYVQFALSNAYFVVACEDQSKMFSALSPLDGGVDIYKGLDVVTPYNIYKNDGSDNRAIVMDIQGEALPFLLSIDHCCGIPAYLNIWYELNDVFDEFDDKTEEEQDESLTLLMTYAQHAVDVLFQNNSRFDDDEETQKEKALFVTSVRRSAKEIEQNQN